MRTRRFRSTELIAAISHCCSLYHSLDEKFSLAERMVLFLEQTRKGFRKRNTSKLLLSTTEFSLQPIPVGLLSWPSGRYSLYIGLIRINTQVNVRSCETAVLEMPYHTWRTSIRYLDCDSVLKHAAIICLIGDVTKIRVIR